MRLPGYLDYKLSEYNTNDLLEELSFRKLSKNEIEKLEQILIFEKGTKFKKNKRLFLI